MLACRVTRTNADSPAFPVIYWELSLLKSMQHIILLPRIRVGSVPDFAWIRIFNTVGLCDFGRRSCVLFDLTEVDHNSRFELTRVTERYSLKSRFACFCT
jgi:hypothetical protein